MGAAREGAYCRLRHQRNGRARFFWPRDLLPKQYPEARIMTWGYYTVVTHGLSKPANKSNIFGDAKDLLYSLDRERAESRPLIFVCHSLGGILVKEVGISENTRGQI
jgi:hypothetical protein